jgi:D-beta-D-heptose 7-phosphate kinase/D-beta-D-heptose 1-phosphate adenosyltransferase
MIKVCTSGYFNPIHVGHLKLLEEASKLGDWLVVIVNNDEQVKLKGSKPFMTEDERCAIVKSIRYVDEVILSIDTDKGICNTLELVHPDIFAKGGDSTKDNVPEQDICDKLDIHIVFDVGGGKIQSSSTLKNNL